MISYLSSWWFGTTTTHEEQDSISNEDSQSSTPPSPDSSSNPDLNATSTSPHVSVSISTPEETQDAIDETIDNRDDVKDFDDTPPAFPSLNSIQRSTVPPPRRNPPTQSESELMPPPTLPTTRRFASKESGTSSTPASKSTGANTTSFLIPPVPNNIRIPPASRDPSDTLKLPPSTTRAPPAPSKRREKVALAPGHSPLDWAALKSSGLQDLRGVSGLMRITPSQLKAHNKRDDAWSAFNGKVYNITPYLSFHPGGEKELLRVAGRDGTKLFALTHAWVNVDIMLDECMVGFLVPEPSSAA